MEPLRFTLSNRKKLLVIPDTIAHLNGHAVLTFTYSVFADDGLSTPHQNRRREDMLHLEETNDPNYFGYITFEKPGHIFRYNPGEMRKLDQDEVEEIIEHLSHVRDNPTLWNMPGY